MLNYFIFNSAGYISNVEIQALISQANGDNPDGLTISQYEDEGDIIIYNDNQWVSWLTPDSYNKRKTWYDGMNFGGSVDWAVDLNRTYGNNGTGDLQESDDEWEEYKPCPTKIYNNLDDLIGASDLPAHCIAQMTLDTLVKMLDVAYDNYTDVNNGYDEMFGYYVTYIEKIVPAVLENAFMWNMSITNQNALVPEIGYGMQCKYPSLPSFPGAVSEFWIWSDVKFVQD